MGPAAESVRGTNLRFRVVQEKDSGTFPTVRGGSALPERLCPRLESISADGGWKPTDNVAASPYAKRPRRAASRVPTWIDRKVSQAGELSEEFSGAG